MSEPHRLTIDTPTELIAAVPYLLGFHPTDSIVVVGLRGRAAVVCSRADLPDLPADGERLHRIIDRLRGLLTGQGIDTALAIGYGPADRVTPAVTAVRDVLGADGIPLAVALRVHGRRWWHLSPTAAQRCPADGHAFDAATTVAAATATAAGLVALPNRADVAARLAPHDGPLREEFTAAAAIVRHRLHHLVTHDDTGRPDLIPVILGRRLTAEVLTDVRAGRTVPLSRTALLAALLDHPHVLDMAVCQAGGHAAELSWWTDVLQHTPTGLVCGPAVMLAFSALLAGDGVLASAAAQRALAANPDHPLAQLAAHLQHQGVDPLTLADALAG